MAILTTYDFKGILIKEAKIKVINIFGSSKGGFNSHIGVYVTKKETIPAVEKVEQVGFPSEPNYVAPIQAKEAYAITKDELIEDFNFQVQFNELERGYETIYKALMDKYGGKQI